MKTTLFEDLVGCALLSLGLGLLIGGASWGVAIIYLYAMSLLALSR